MKKQIYLLISMTCIIAALILVKNNYAHYLLGNAEFGMQKIIKQKEIDMLFIGSSVCRQGVDTIILEEQGFEDVYVLSYNGNQPFTELLELKYLLEQGVKIKNLYLDLYVNTITATPWISDNKLLLDTDYEFKKELWQELRANNNVEITDAIQFWGSSNNEILLTWPIYYPIVNSSFHKGGTLLKTEGMEEEILDDGELADEVGGIANNEVQVNAIREIAKLAVDNGIKLTYLEVPQYSTEQLSKRYQEQMQNYIAVLEEENIEYILTELSAEQIGNKSCRKIYFDSYDKLLFSDNIHCSSAGRTLYTEKLCENIEMFQEDNHPRE